ncbi:MAG: IS1634 family transposase [Pseudomonadota bacterium]
MYFKISTAKGNKYLQIVESYRNEQGKPRQRLIATICNVSQCSEEQVLRLCKSFLRALGVEKIAFLDDLTCGQSYDYGDVLPIIALWQQLGLEQIINDSLSSRVKIDVAKATLIMVANKFVDPQSKLGAWKWFERSLFTFAKEFVHLPCADNGLLHTLYRSLDYLCDSKQAIEKELYYRLQCYGLQTEFVLYDITLSYFEGDQAELAEYGYSRDHRPDRPQIVIGILTSKEGVPFAHHVFDGNTADKSTVKDVIDDLKDRFGITHCTFVGDRGMLTRINLEAIKGMEYDYIMGMRRHNSRIVAELIPFIEQAPEQEVIEVKMKQISNTELQQEFGEATRFVIGYNEAVRDKVRQTRQKKFDDVELFLEPLATAGSYQAIADSHSKVISYLNKRKIGRYYEVSVEKNEAAESVECYRLVVQQRKDIIDQEKLIDGHYFIQTELDEQKLTSDEVISAYKSLQKVERIFRVLKNNIEIRPIYVRKEKRIRGHVFICFITYLFECLLERKLAEKLPDCSLSALKIDLNRVKLIPVTLSDRITSKTGRLFFVTSASSDVLKLYSLLKIRNYREPEKLYITSKDKSTDNFSNQLALFPLFSG